MLRGIAKYILVFSLLPLSFAGYAKVFKDYEYDAVGNIVSIKQVDPSLAIYSFSPAAGPAGSIVTIHGNLFSGVVDQNAVAFNGASAPVLSATETTLIVRVPESATTGPVSVSVQGETVYSENDFIVADEGGGPVIYDFSPKCGTKGVTISVNGDRFDLDNAATLAGIEGNLTAADVVNTEELSFLIPTNASTGRVRVITPLGMASSSDILLIPPTGSGITCADVALTRSFLSIGETSFISYEANQKHVVFFEAEEGDLLTLQFTEKATSPDNTYIYYQIYDSSGALFLSSSSFKTESKTAHVPQITKAGIYTLLLSAYKNNSASFQLSLTRDRMISTDAEAMAFSTTIAEQTYRIGFYSNDEQSLGFALQQMLYDNTASSNNATNIQVFAPDGKVYSRYNYIESSSSCYLFRGRMCDLDLPAINQAGLYTVVIRPAVNTTIQAAVGIVSNIQASLNGGQPLPLTLNKIGQNAWLDFEGTANQNVNMILTDIQLHDQGSSYAFITVYVIKPGGALHKSASIRGATGQLALGALPETGAYRILISPSYGSRAAMTVTLNGGA